MGRTEGLTKWLVDPASQRLLGCGIVGYGAGDLVSEAVVAIEMGATVRDLVDSIHPHPTLSETLGNAAEVFLARPPTSTGHAARRGNCWTRQLGLTEPWRGVRERMVGDRRSRTALTLVSSGTRVK